MKGIVLEGMHHGFRTASTLRKFKAEFSQLRESTVS